MSDQTSLPKNSGSKQKRDLAQHEAEHTIINSIQQGLASRLGVQAIYDLVGDEIQVFFNAQVVMISTYDPQTDSIEHRYTIERGKRVYVPGHSPNRGFRAQIVQKRQPVLVNTNVAKQAARLGQPTLPGTITPKSWLGVPMLVGDQVTGILSLQNVEQENAFHESDVRLLQTFASSMSVALENARLFDETQRLLKETEQRNAELAIINSVLEGLAKQLDFQKVIDLIGEKVGEIFKADTTNVSMIDVERDWTSNVYYVDRGERISFPDGPAARPSLGAIVIDERKPLLAGTSEETEKLGALRMKRSGEKEDRNESYLGVPILTGDKLIGLITVQSYKQNAFNQSDVRLLETLANSMSVALENARLREQEKIYLTALEREFEIGREIQTGFLPDTLPQPKGWEIAALLQPAREVAGDFYDVFELPNETIGLVIADVCDKGLGAALFMTLFRSFIRAVSNIEFYARTGSGDENSSEDRLMNAISLTNNYIAETHGDTGMFATVFFGILNPHTGALTYINGGHQPPMLIDKHGVKEILRLTGPAVGAVPNANYAIREVVIKKGDSFFAYTDGLPDTENPAGEYFNEKELIPLFAGDQILSSLLVKIQKQIETYATGVQQFDDITMLAVRRKKK